MDSILWFFFLIGCGSFCSSMIFTPDSENNIAFLELLLAVGPEGEDRFSSIRTYKRIEICEQLLSASHFVAMNYQYVEKNAETLSIFVHQCGDCILDHGGKMFKQTKSYHQVKTKVIQAHHRTIERKSFGCIYYHSQSGFGELFVSDSFMDDTYIISQRHGFPTQVIPYLGIAEFQGDKNIIEEVSPEHFFSFDNVLPDTAYDRFRTMSESRKQRLCQIIYNQLYNGEPSTDVTGTIILRDATLQLENSTADVIALGCQVFHNTRSLFYLALSQEKYQRVHVLNPPDRAGKLTLTVYYVDNIPTLNAAYNRVSFTQ